MTPDGRVVVSPLMDQVYAGSRYSDVEKLNSRYDAKPFGLLNVVQAMALPRSCGFCAYRLC